MMTSKGVIKNLGEKNKGIYESSATSILAYLQAPLEKSLIESALTKLYTFGKMRAASLSILTSLMKLGYLP